MKPLKSGIIVHRDKYVLNLISSDDKKRTIVVAPYYGPDQDEDVSKLQFRNWFLALSRAIDVVTVSRGRIPKRRSFVERGVDTRHHRCSKTGQIEISSRVENHIDDFGFIRVSKRWNPNQTTRKIGLRTTSTSSNSTIAKPTAVISKTKITMDTLDAPWPSPFPLPNPEAYYVFETPKPASPTKRLARRLSSLSPKRRGRKKTLSRSQSASPSSLLKRKSQSRADR